jgi:TIR domain-containing protein/FRG domain-containing protein
MNPEATAAWDTFLANIETARKEIGCSPLDSEEAWFRGHTNSNYQLLPSLFRSFEEPNTESSWDKIIQIESDLFWEFAARARQIHGKLENHWDILFAMQHYGTPTRLLDWSETLAVAIYFAILDIDTAAPMATQELPEPCIWVLNPYRLNKLEWSGDLVHPPYLGWDDREREYYEYSDLLVEGYMDWDWPTAIYPSHRTDRIEAQNGWFTIHGDEFVPIDKLRRRRSFLRKIPLPHAALEPARRFLQLSGIHHYSIFADLESLSLHLKEKNGLIPRARAKEAERARVKQRDSGNYYSCYLSYSTKDEEFARRLYSRLRDAKVRVWFWPENIKTGEMVHEQIETAIQAHDKLLIVLSKASLQSEWVMTELREAQGAERRSGKRKLFPVRLVDFRTLDDAASLKQKSGKNVAAKLGEYGILDFSNWKDHDQFEATFSRLLRDLRTESPLPAARQKKRAKKTKRRALKTPQKPKRVRV